MLQRVSDTVWAHRDKLVYDIGTFKLADFGLSKSLPSNKHAQYEMDDDTFKLTGETGSYRYMVRTSGSCADLCHACCLCIHPGCCW